MAIVITPIHILLKEMDGMESEGLIFNPIDLHSTDKKLRDKITDGFTAFITPTGHIYRSLTIDTIAYDPKEIGQILQKDFGIHPTIMFPFNNKPLLQYFVCSHSTGSKMLEELSKKPERYMPK